VIRGWGEKMTENMTEKFKNYISKINKFVTKNGKEIVFVLFKNGKSVTYSPSDELPETKRRRNGLFENCINKARRAKMNAIDKLFHKNSDNSRDSKSETPTRG